MGSEKGLWGQAWISSALRNPPPNQESFGFSIEPMYPQRAKTHVCTHTCQNAPRPCSSVLRCRRSPPSRPGPARPGTSYDTTHSNTCVVLTSMDVAAACGWSPFGMLLLLLLLLPLTPSMSWSAAILLWSWLVVLCIVVVG